jgi:TadE-like protein
MRFTTRTIRNLLRGTGGTEIAEAAAILPLLFMAIMGIFWFSQAFRLYGTITRAAQEGARAGAQPNCSTCSVDSNTQQAINAVNAVNAVLSTSKLDTTLPAYPNPRPIFNSCSGFGGTNCIGAASGKVCVQAPVQLSNSFSGSGVCGISVSFTYPFTFPLPFASIGNRTINLRAQARVRMETQ